MEQNVTYVCAGTRYTESYIIANTGENGGNDYSFHKNYCEIYTDKKIIINPIICTILSKIINESKRCGDFVAFIEAGDRSPVFYYDESLSIFVARLLEIMLNCGFFKNKNIFMAKDLNVGGRKRVLRKDNPCLCDFIYNVDYLYCLNDILKDYLKHSYSKFSDLFKDKIYYWNYIAQDNIIPNHLCVKCSFSPNRNLNSMNVGVKCGYVYPFDEFITTQEDTYECICHKPIFTIFLTQEIKLSYQERVYICNIIANLCTLDKYSEPCSLCENKFKFEFNKKLNDIIIILFNAMFNGIYIFEDGNFNPEAEIGYREKGLYVERIYKTCVNLNAQLYKYDHPYYPIDYLRIQNMHIGTRDRSLYLTD